jgi:hypothetical protein
MLPATPYLAPDANIVDGYSVLGRAGQPTIRFYFTEATRVMTPITPCTVAANTITVPAWEGRTDILGSPVEGHDKVQFGVVWGWDPATAVATIVGTIPPGLTEVTAHTRNNAGHDHYQPCGNQWQVVFYTSTLEGTQALGSIMYGVSSNHVARIIKQAGTTNLTPEVLGAAIASMLSQGISMDDSISEFGEQIELARQAGSLAGAAIVGNAPLVG